jgi:hypothetical protein
MDLSGSIMDESNVNLALNFTHDVVAGLDINNDNYRVGVVTYATTVHDEIFFNEYMDNQQGLLDALRFYLTPDGTTNTQAALAAMRTDIFGAANGGFRGPGVRSNVRQIGILLSDGNSNVMQGNTIPEANLAKAAGIVMYSIAIDINHNMTELNGVSSNPAANVFPLYDSSYLSSAVSSLLNALCSSNTIQR